MDKELTKERLRHYAETCPMSIAEFMEVLRATNQTTDKLFAAWVAWRWEYATLMLANEVAANKEIDDEVDG